ncbi:MAG: 2-keto-3-deoxygluconate permease [Pyramidobacter sp.]|uniref:2-keto-3-deoxygluconate permease n=1 Tax=unclassified Pyramidobacter TaxID=2632171 RepID=UPI000EA0D996|nr:MULTISPECIES: 2-keto-3-deoxygluconate permease [unclassified Pyramidobacter]MDY4031457.1 2-keto-3-deoxygluconate permease [Pyramidobacter sp.]RKJ80839.1 2-keto-3-deoxygluconate permease [Pyramidobacter sp. CG50-2]
MKILKTVQKIPGGLMVVPLLLGVVVNSVFPKSIQIGGFTTALFKNGATALIALFCLCNAAQINVRQAGKPLAKGILLTASKFFIGAFIGWGVGKFAGPAGVLGLTPLAIVAAVTNSNGGLYAALAGQYGDSTDVGAISILSLNDGPFFTMLAFGLTGLANIPFLTFVAALVPIVLGFILGNLDEDLRKFLASGTTVLIPFFAFPLGSSLSFSQLLRGGLPGIVLGVMCTALTGMAGYFVIRAMGERKASGAAIGTTAGNAVGTPAVLAAADPSLSAVEAISTVQVAAAIIVTAILCPLLCNLLDRRLRKRYGTNPDGSIRQEDR